MIALITAIEDTLQGQSLISNCKPWNDTVHNMQNRRLTIFPSLSGVVMATIHRLFDLDYNVSVIRHNVLESPLEQMAEVAQVIVDILLPKMKSSVISIEEVIGALGRP
ncbi:hypothetical protein BDW68DRAFT_181481 [Aspergillus falconensis]